MTARVRGVVAGLAAIGTLAAIIVGLPIVLYRLGGWPWPRHLASWHRIAAILASRSDGGILVAVIRDCTWLAWLLFSVSVIAEAYAAHARGPSSKATARQPAGCRGAAGGIGCADLHGAATPNAGCFRCGGQHPARRRIGNAGAGNISRHPASRLSQREPAGRLRFDDSKRDQADYSARRRLPVVDCAALPRLRGPVSRDSRPQLRPQHGSRTGLRQSRADRTGLAVAAAGSR